MSLSEKQYPPYAQTLHLLEITSSLSIHLQRLNEVMERQVENFEPDIQEMVSYCLNHSGKRLRPILVFCSGWSDQESSLASQSVTIDNMPDNVTNVESNFDNLIKIASIIEWIHIASLVHDDILDGATLRRKRLTVNQVYGPRNAVLLGDALFAQALRLTTEFSQSDVSRRIAEATLRVCSGEISQTLQQHSNTPLSIATYFKIIDLKTAELFSLSCFMGAQFGGYSMSFSKAVSLFGHYLGRAYQVYDDIADLWGEEAQFGKTLGTDLAQGKLTLPLLLLFEKIVPEQKTEILQNIQKESLSMTNLKKLLRRHNIFEISVESFLKEIEMAEKAIEPFKDLPATKQLLTTSNFIKSQPQKLNPY